MKKYKCHRCGQKAKFFFDSTRMNGSTCFYNSPNVWDHFQPCPDEYLFTCKKCLPIDIALQRLRGNKTNLMILDNKYLSGYALYKGSLREFIDERV